MELLRLDHFTLRVGPSSLPPLLDFYTRVLPLREGPRPDFPFPGHWLYAGGSPVVHLAGIEPATSQPAPQSTQPTGQLDHISLRAQGLTSTRAHLAAQGVSWQEAPVPGFPLHQIFLQDPLGLKIELTFDSDECRISGH